MSSKSANQNGIPAEGRSKNAAGKGDASPSAPVAEQCSQQDMRAYGAHCAEMSSIREISIIENMTSFLEANGAAELDQEVLRNMAEALSKRINDTSPGTLQDVTMDNSYGVGYRSPCVSLQQYQGTTSPAGQGRSVREFEEQMATLRKENFNLKLRLYFIEESIPGYHQSNGGDGSDTLSKQLIDAKVEMEMLRKEIQEKQQILKDAAQAMNQMEKIQKETEARSQAVVDELKQKIQYLEMERDMEKSNSGELMNNLLGLSDISENMNALQKIRELEGIVKQSDDKISDFQNQITKLDNILSKRDEVIKEYEEKVKELVFQNAEILEALENKEKEVANAERVLRSLRMSNADLKEDNQNLADALNDTRENFRKEMSNMKMYERQTRDQQEALSKMQSTIAIKTQNTARLLERIQDYEKTVTRMNFERNLTKRENRFFRAIIGKLQSNKSECYTIEKEFHQQIRPEFDDKLIAEDEHYDATSLEGKARGEYHREFKLKHKLCVNYCNHGNFPSTSLTSEGERSAGGGSSLSISCRNGRARASGFLQSYCDAESDVELEIPIRYTISDVSMYGNDGAISKTNSCSSLHANISSSSVLAGSRDLMSDEVFLKSQRLREELQEHKTELADKTCMLQEAEEQLQNRIQIHEQACRSIQKLMLSIKNQQEEINRLKNQQQAANIAPAMPSNKEPANGSCTKASVDLECTGLCRSMSDTEAFNGQRQKLEATIKQQETQIQSLKSEIKKKTANLQNLVNKELWEKNREIERLTRLINNKSSSSPLSPSKVAAAASDSAGNTELQLSFSEVEYAKALERNKSLQRKVDILIQRLGVERNNEALVVQLRTDLREARSDADKAEKWRRECADVCTVLTNRLEELAGFLNSLLKHKDVLGVLAADRRRAIRKAVDRSLDLSKSLNRTLSISGISMADQSLAQLSNLSEILGDYEGADLENRTFNSHEEQRAQQSIETLQAENKALKKELYKSRSVGADLKKDRRSLPLQNLEHSESEAWSEPDRKVSLARIGLEDHSASLVKELAPTQQADTDSESDAAAAGVTNQSQSKPVNLSQSGKTRTQERLVQLEQMIAQRDDRILDIATKLVEADNRLKKENLRVLDMSQEIEQLRKRNDELHQDLINIGGAGAQESADQSLLLHQIDEKTRSLEKIQEERDRIVVEARLAELQIGALKADMQELHIQQQQALTMAVAQEQSRLQQLRQEMETVMQQRLAEQERQHRETLARDWIARALYEETKQQLLELQRQYTEAQRNIDCLQENEQELKQTLVDGELGSRALKKQLDESTLQASKAVLERTKALNDKLQLEKRVQELTEQLSTHEVQRQTLQQQVAELERVQQQQLNSKTAGATPLNNSDVSQSGYTSEEVPAAAVPALVCSHGSAAGAQRHNNSSPDLGIESDAGRISGLELANAQHSRLKTVELKGSGEQQRTSIKAEPSDGVEKKPKAETAANPTSAIINHDCAKVEQENAEMRRKLIRTKRAFEDTYEKLRIANQRKALVEKDIKNQIIKTHNVLKNVRSNMEN